MPRIVPLSTVIAHSNQQRRRPAFDTVLQGSDAIYQVPAYITDLYGRVHKFLLAYTCNSEPRNQSLRWVYPGVVWHGELIVMKGGVRDDVVHLNSRQDRQLAEIAAERCDCNDLTISLMLIILYQIFN